MNTPRWRWFFFCLCLDLSWRTGWRWSGRLMSWCVLPEWVGVVDGQDSASTGDGEAPW